MYVYCILKKQNIFLKSNKINICMCDDDDDDDKINIFL